MQRVPKKQHQPSKTPQRKPEHPHNRTPTKDSTMQRVRKKQRQPLVTPPQQPKKLQRLIRNPPAKVQNL